MLAPLTPRQKDILDFITTYQELHKISPSLEEIRDHFGLKAVSTIHEHVEKLKKKGYLRKEMNQARGIRTTLQNNISEILVEVDILGEVVDSLEVDHYELSKTVKVAAYLLAETDRHYALHISTKKFVSDGILQGDLILIGLVKDYSKGDLLVVSDGKLARLVKCGGEEGLSKKVLGFYDPLSSDRVGDSGGFEVRGKMISLIRRYH